MSVNNRSMEGTYREQGKESYDLDFKSRRCAEGMVFILYTASLQLQRNVA